MIIIEKLSGLFVQMHIICGMGSQLTTTLMDDHLRESAHGKGLHIAHLNVRSMLSVNTLDLLLTQIRTSGIGVFTISETWLHQAIPSSHIAVDTYMM